MKYQPKQGIGNCKCEIRPRIYFMKNKKNKKKKIEQEDEEELHGYKNNIKHWYTCMSYVVF